MNFACNLSAFSPGERRQWSELVKRVMDSIRFVHDREDGFVLDLTLDRVTLEEVQKWAALEGKCCPFFEIEAKTDGQGAQAILRGPAEAKQYILAELPEIREKLALYSRESPARFQP